MKGNHQVDVRYQWMAREGSGQSFLEYALVLCCSAAVTAVFFSAFGGEISALLQGAVNLGP